MTPAQLSQQLQSRFDVPVGFREYQIRRPYPCSIAAVDELLGGGFPRGAVSEISRNQFSNRTALTVSTLVHALDAGECYAWIDAGGTFDPESAAEAGLHASNNCSGLTAKARLKRLSKLPICCCTAVGSG